MLPSNSVTVAVVKNNLLSIAREMRETMIRTSPATVIYEDLDFASGLVDAKGGLLAEAPGLTAFMGTLPPAVQKCVSTIGEENIHDSDIIMATTPLYTGSHPPEGVIFTPIFFGNRLFAYATDKGHLVDFGGKDPYPTDSTDPFQEGLRIPPVRLFKKGELDSEIKQIIMYNSRAPETVWREIMAQIGAVQVAKQRVKKLLEKYGFETAVDCLRQINDFAEKETLNALAKMPEGSWSGEDYCDDDGVVRGKRIKIKMTFTVRADRLVIDYTGSDEQQKGPMNSPIINTISNSRLMAKLLTAPYTPAHEGSFRPLEVIAPFGSIFNVDSNVAPTMLYGWPSDASIELMFKILAPIFPDRLPTCSGGDLGALLRYGWHPRTRNFWLEASIEGCGQGASKSSDGGNALIIMSEACSRNLPCEVEETRAPVITERYELQQDSGGAGKYRGGLGIRRDWRCLGPGHLISVIERSFAPHWGTDGGKPGSRNFAIVTTENSEVEKYATTKTAEGYELLKAPSVLLSEGDLVSLRLGGGGGWGDPFGRDMEAVGNDVKQGYVSIKSAREDYGVVVDPDDLHVDVNASLRLRRDFRK